MGGNQAFTLTALTILLLVSALVIGSNISGTVALAVLLEGYKALGFLTLIFYAQAILAAVAVRDAPKPPTEQ